ncbi:MAG: alpha/beta fold hydrolase [Bryobacteraceae bacterium]
MEPFVPLIRNSHFLTIAGNFWRRRLDVRRFPVERTLLETEPGVQVLVETQCPQSTPLGEIVLIHGLEGSGEAGYMRSMAQAGLEAGYVMHRFHMRTCGGTESLCRTLYHAGLTGDLLVFLRGLEREGRTPVALAGYSLGGNVVLKLSGELGAEAPGLISRVCAISAPIDLAACSRRMGQIDNRLYERRFVAGMRRRLLAMKRATPGQLRGVRTLFDFDDRFTAPSFGFRDAAHYYATQSACGYLERIQIPALLIQARDDTFIPFSVFDHPALRANPNLRLLATEHGGHLGFLARGKRRYWVDEVVLEYLSAKPAAMLSSKQ